MKKIEVVNTSELFSLELDIALLKAKHPAIFDAHIDKIEQMDIWDVESLLPSDESVANLIKRLPAVRLYKSNGEINTVFNTDIIAWNGLPCDGYKIYADDNYIYFLVSRCAYQAGSLGIWNIKKDTWEFTHSDECFCVEVVVYIKALNKFLGFCEWDYPMSPAGGGFFFIIDINRNYEDLALIEDSTCDEKSLTISIDKELWSVPENRIRIDEQRSRIVLFRNGKAVVFNALCLFGKEDA